MTPKTFLPKFSQKISRKFSHKFFLTIFTLGLSFLARPAPTQAQTFDLPGNSPESFLRNFCASFLAPSADFPLLEFSSAGDRSFAQNSQFFKILCGDLAPTLFDESFTPQIQETQSRTGFAISRVQSGSSCDRRPPAYALEFCDFPALATDFLRPVLTDFFALKKSQILGTKFGDDAPALDQLVTDFLQTTFLILPDQKPFNFPDTRRDLRKYFRDGQNLAKTPKIFNPETFADQARLDPARTDSLNIFTQQILFEQLAFDIFLDSYGYRVEIHANLEPTQKTKIRSDIEDARLAIHESIDTALADLLDFNFSYKIFIGQKLYAEILDEVRHKIAGAMTPLRALPTLFQNVQIPEN